MSASRPRALSVDSNGGATRAVGTVPATKAKTLGAGLPLARLPQPWGGARNTRHRTSDGLTAKQVADLIDGAAFAWAAGVPFNRHVTIHWEAIGITDDHAAAATTAFLKRATDWTRKAGGQFAAVWARESGDGKGSHVHILLHVPTALTRRYSAMPRRWLKALRGDAPHVKGTLHTRSIGGSLTAAGAVPEHYAENLRAVVGYIVKGALPAAAEAHGLSKLEPGGRIIGKRAGTTRNIGRAAQQAAGWRGGVF